MMKKCFSRGLYFDTLRRLRVAGLLLTLLCFASVLTQLIPELSTTVRNRWNVQLPLDFAMVLVCFSMLAPVVLMLQTFAFLFRRSGSDFYHGQPYMRQCLGCTLFAAAMTWSVAMLGLSLLACAVLIPLSPFLFPLPLLGWMLAYNLVLMLLIAGCMLIGISWAGKPLEAALIAGLALCLPRAGMAVFRYIMVNASGMMVYNDAHPFFSLAMHLPSASAVLFYRGYDVARLLGKTIPQLFSYAPGIAYSLLLALLAIAWGLRCFARRKSELAGHPLARPIQRHLLHAGVALAGLLWCGYLLHEVIGYHRGWMAWARGGWTLTALGVFLLLYLVFQRMRSKSWRTLSTAAPCMLLAIAIAFAVCGGAVLVGRNTYADLPKVSEIAWVCFPAQPGDATVMGWELEQRLTDGIRYEKPEMRAFVADAMAEQAHIVAEINAGNVEGYASADVGGNQLTMEVTRTDGRKFRRTVRLNQARWNLVPQLMMDSPDFVAALRQEPKAAAVELVGLDTLLMPEGESRTALLRTLQTDLEALGDLDFLRRTSVRYAMPDALREERERNLGDFCRVGVYAWRGYDLVERGYGVDAKTKRTADACLQALNQHFQAQYQTVLAAMDGALHDRWASTVSYNLEFSYQVDKGGREVDRFGELYRQPPWEERFGEVAQRHAQGGRFSGGNADEQEPPDREVYEQARLANDAAVFDILRRSPLAESEGENVVLVKLCVPIWNEKTSLYDWPEGKAYLVVSPEDKAALDAMAQAR